VQPLLSLLCCRGDSVAPPSSAFICGERALNNFAWQLPRSTAQYVAFTFAVY
jgi:hypothetical protein